MKTGLINELKKESNKANEVLVYGIDFLVNESSIPVPKSGIVSMKMTKDIS